MYLRLALAVGAGTLVTATLFFSMSSLIDLGFGVDDDKRPRPELVFVREKPVESIETDEPRPERIPDVPPPPATPLMTDDQGQGPVRFAWSAPTPPTDDTGLRFAPLSGDGPLVAIVRVQPSYPPRAISLGLEGYAIVEFTVGPDGTTSDHRVIETSHTVFGPAAIRAAERFRFKPKVVSGVPVETSGVRNLFRFEIDKN